MQRKAVRNATPPHVANTAGPYFAGIQQLHDALAPQQTEGTGEQAYLMRGQPVLLSKSRNRRKKVPRFWAGCPALANLERLYNLPGSPCDRLRYRQHVGTPTKDGKVENDTLRQ
jgi:hypothetical protein